LHKANTAFHQTAGHQRLPSEVTGEVVIDARKVKILERNETMADVLHAPNGFG
jgi:hypothetical protein